MPIHAARLALTRSVTQKFAITPKHTTPTTHTTTRLDLHNQHGYYLNLTSIPSQSNIYESNPNCSPRRCAVTSSRRLRRTSIERVAGIARVLVKVEPQLLANLGQWVFREHLGSVGRWAGGQPVGGAFGCTLHLATWLHGAWILPWVPVSSHGRTILYASENACWLERGNGAPEAPTWQRLRSGVAGSPSSGPSGKPCGATRARGRGWVGGRHLHPAANAEGQLRI